MRASFAVFFVTLLAVLALLNVYVARRAARAFALSPRTRRGLAISLGVSLAGMVLARVLDRLVPDAPVGTVLVVASTVELAVILTAVLLAALDATSFVVRSARRLVAGIRHAAAKAEPPPAEPPPLESTPRRAFLAQAATGSALLIGSSSSLYGALSGRHDYTIEEVPVRIDGLSRALDGFSIVQLSDVHIGQFVGDAELAAAEAFVKRARPDLVVLTGDLLDHDPRLAPRLGRFVERLRPLAREGVVAISGNHDFYAGIRPFVTALEAGGAEVLRNRGRVIGGASGFALLGVDDVWAARQGRGGGPNLERAVRSLPAIDGKLARAGELPRVLLCHNPIYFEEAAGSVALQLSGHTHGGQVNPGVRPADWLLKNGWVAGLYAERGSRLYVNRGFGTVGPPVRLGAPPEITRIVLTT